MTFERAIAHVTRHGELLLDALERIDQEIMEDPDFVDQLDVIALRVIRYEMRPLFFGDAA